MQTVDIHRRQLHAAVGDDAHQFRQRIRPIAGTADGAGQGRHHMAEGIALALPVLVDPLEGLLFQQDADAPVLRGAATRLEQPGIDFLPLLRAGLHQFGAGGPRMRVQPHRQPQFQRMRPGQVALVVERVAIRIILVEQVPHVSRIELLLRQLRAQEGAQLLHRRPRSQRAEQQRLAARLGIGAVGKQVQRLFGVEPVVVIVVAIEVGPSFLVGEAPQVLLAQRLGGDGVQLPRTLLLRRVVARQVAQQADERQIDRKRESLLHRRIQMVLGLVEIAEHLVAAAGQEHCGGVGGIAPLHGGIEHGLQRVVFRLQQIGGRPGAQRVRLVAAHRFELVARQRLQALAQLAHHIQVGDQGAQLGGRAQDQLGAGIDIEWLVEAVGAHPQKIAVGAALVQHHAVGHAVEVLVVEQVVPDQAQRSGVVRIAEVRQDIGDALLRLLVNGGGHAQIEPVQAVQIGRAKQRQQFAAQRIGRLASHIGHRLGWRRLNAQHQRDTERGIAQSRVDEPLRAQQSQVTIGQGVQRLDLAGQVPARAPLRQQQAQHLLVNLRPAQQPAAGLQRVLQYPIGLRRIDAIPGPQAFAETDDLPIGRPRTERGRIKIGRRELTPRRHGVGAILVDAQARGFHLPYLFGVASGPASVGMAELLDLRRQRACPALAQPMVEPAAQLAGHGEQEA